MTVRGEAAAAERYLQEFQSPGRLCMGAGPSNIHPRVVQAMSASILGHLDPDMRFVLEDVSQMLRLVFQTENTLTLPVSGTGMAGMEACLVNVVEPGDTVVVAVNGYFGQRLVSVATRCGADVQIVAQEPGLPVDADAVRAEARRHAKVKAVAVVHAETSTGVLTPLPELAEVAHHADALFIVDAVTSLGGIELKLDEWGVDVCYSGTQKCMACPSGLSPVTLNERAVSVIERRKTPVQSYYLDLQLLRGFWLEGGYHHTVSAPLVFALREGLRLILEEGLERRQDRHSRHGAAFQAGVGAMGLSLLASEPFRTPSLAAVVVPEGVEGTVARRVLFDDFNTEISGGLGDQAASLWRVGLMGYNSTIRNVLYVLSALEDALLRQGFEVPLGEGVAAAQRSLQDNRRAG